MKFDLIIVGGGLAGLAAAVALRKSRLSIAIVEPHLAAKQPYSEWDARIYAYSPASAKFLQELGVWQHLDRERLCAVAEMKVYGDEQGALRFSAYESGLQELAWIGESRLVHDELRESVKRQHNVTLFCPRIPVSARFEDASICLELDGGDILTGRLLVGADGRDSWVRDQSGLATRSVPYGEMGVVANFECEGDHRGIAYQWFRGDGVLAWLPLPGRMMSMVWSVKDDFAQSLLQMNEQELCSRVERAGGRLLGKLSLRGRPAAFPLRLMRVESVVRQRVALIGDAAHAIHPLSGHGINLGFQDAKALAELLEAAPEWRDIGDYSFLRRYARKRAEEPFMLQYATHGLNRLFAARNPAAAFFRNAGLNLTGRLPVLTNSLVRYAVSGKFS
ncbi:UbiH/UbiF family hydroxylase [Azoarcus indigens]|uniref:UbiH/UbiF family hydroxylase n=1 Tax=Azoarcus indigens TaxID=29545 RepID=UPI0010605BF3|nr:UbiH/UbiF family hydroxylase [Azoarcus indigens]NMG64074.1 UbiH/UbiF family hydroxylase [Azoarcus indigens]